MKNEFNFADNIDKTKDNADKALHGGKGHGQCRL